MFYQVCIKHHRLTIQARDDDDVSALFYSFYEIKEKWKMKRL